jgi:hypothetical protein
METKPRIGRPPSADPLILYPMRFPRDLLALVDQHAADNFMARTEAIRALILAGLVAVGSPPAWRAETEGERELERRHAEMKRRVFKP